MEGFTRGDVSGARRPYFLDQLELRVTRSTLFTVPTLPTFPATAYR